MIMELIFGNRKNNKTMPLWAIGRSAFLLDSSPPYPIFVTKHYAEFMLGAVIADSSKNQDAANVYPLPVLRCIMSSDKEELDVNKVDFNKLIMHKSISAMYPAPFLAIRLVGRAAANDKNEMYGMRDYSYFNGLAQALNSSMAYVINLTKIASAASTKAEAINFAFNQAAKNGGMTSQDVLAFFRAYTTIKLLVSINIMHLKTQFAPGELRNVKSLDKFHRRVVQEFNERDTVAQENWSSSCKILNAYDSLVDSPSFHTTPEFQRLITQFKNFGVFLTLPMTAKAGDIPPL